MRAQGGDGEIEPLDAQRRQPEDDADEGGHDAGEDEQHGSGKEFEGGGEFVGREGADRHEPRRAERNLPAIAEEDVQPHRRDGVEQERQQHRMEQIFVGDGRNRDGREDAQDGDSPPVLADGEHALVGAVGGLELPGLAVDHVSAPCRVGLRLSR